MKFSVGRGGELPHLLLVEPNGLIRSTVSGVCKQLELVQVHQAASISVAEIMLDQQDMDLMLISMHEGDHSFGFLERLRAGGWSTPADLPVAVTAGSAEQILVSRLRPFHVTRLLLLPYKIRDLVTTIEGLLGARGEPAPLRPREALSELRYPHRRHGDLPAGHS